MWRKKTSHDSSKSGRGGGGSTSNGESVHSTFGKQKSGDLETQNSQGVKLAICSGSLQTPSVFERLSSPKVTPQRSREEKEVSQKNSSSGSKEKRRNSEESRKSGENPPLTSVFERLGKGVMEREDPETSTHKRRRFSTSDERISKRARKGSMRNAGTLHQSFTVWGAHPQILVQKILVKNLILLI